MLICFQHFKTPCINGIFASYIIAKNSATPANDKIYYCLYKRKPDSAELKKTLEILDQLDKQDKKIIIRDYPEENYPGIKKELKRKMI